MSRLRGVGRRRAGTAPPPPTVDTIFGYNTNEFDTFNQTLAGRRAWWNDRAPCVRRYNSGFVPASFPITTAVAPERRVSYSFKCDNRGAGTFDPAGLATGSGNARFRTFIDSIPANWTVYLTYFHEVNDDIRDYNAGIRTGKAISHTEFKAAYGQLYGVLQAARAQGTLNSGVTVKLCANFMAYNLEATGTGPTATNAFFHDQWVPSHSQMDLLTFDIYGNPGEGGATSTGSNVYGAATGTGYGTKYPLVATRFGPMFAIIDRLGWGDHWGILEINTPARSWDVTESSRAQWHVDAIEHCLARPTAPEVVLLWEAPSGVNWDQAFGRVGPVTACVNALAPYIEGSP